MLVHIEFIRKKKIRTIFVSK